MASPSSEEEPLTVALACPAAASQDALELCQTCSSAAASSRAMSDDWTAPWALRSGVISAFGFGAIMCRSSRMTNDGALSHADCSASRISWTSSRSFMDWTRSRHRIRMTFTPHRAADRPSDILAASCSRSTVFPIPIGPVRSTGLGGKAAQGR
eukprot:scaffold7375_cov268-Pinguiococcus_pyrenoidosus.AAC.20